MRSVLVILCAAALSAIGAPAYAAATCGGAKQPACGNSADGAAKGQATEGVYTGGGSGGGKHGPPSMAVKGEGAGTGDPPCKSRRGHPCSSVLAPPQGGQTPGHTPN